MAETTTNPAGIRGWINEITVDDLIKLYWKMFLASLMFVIPLGFLYLVISNWK